ncbi:DUF4328 domain-containing protein [Actinoplanes sp. TFC3]|uniref:DUF4328 domain-containing protein n=1 Tax=Actinoplanes sp. TFC3 TaxID=1710355 RepID=UPI00082B5865|nr:DUF4328 domain-containing protein [Actinoplanes sp. TFC3]
MAVLAGRRGVSAIAALMLMVGCLLVDYALVAASLGNGGTERYEQSDVGVVISVLGIFATLYAGISFIAWLRRARECTSDVGAHPRWGVRWALWGWLIPGANFVIPLLMVNEVDKNAEKFAVPPASRLSRLVFFLWAVLWTIYQVTWFPWPGMTPSLELTLTKIDTAAGVTAAILAALLIRRITTNLESVPYRQTAGYPAYRAPLTGYAFPPATSEPPAGQASQPSPAAPVADPWTPSIPIPEASQDGRPPQE